MLLIPLFRRVNLVDRIIKEIKESSTTEHTDYHGCRKLELFPNFGIRENP